MLPVPADLIQKKFTGNLLPVRYSAKNLNSGKVAEFFFENSGTSFRISGGFCLD
jgi:hypothetical protein